MIESAPDAPALSAVPHPVPFEVIDSGELAKRLCLPESWVRGRVRVRSEDPIPHIKIGRYIRFEWGSYELLV